MKDGITTERSHDICFGAFPPESHYHLNYQDKQLMHVFIQHEKPPQYEQNTWGELRMDQGIQPVASQRAC